MVPVIRSLGLATVLSITASASASFDLLLQSDFDANQGHHVDRYDPVSKTYLGNFSIAGAATGMIADVSRGVVYVGYAGGRLDVVNYSTGALVRTVNTDVVTRDLEISANGNTLHLLTGTSLRNFNLSTWALSTINLAGTTSAGAMETTANGGFIVGDNGSGTWRLYNSSGGLLSSTNYVNHAFIDSLSKRVEIGGTNEVFRAAGGGVPLYGVTVSGTLLAASQTNLSSISSSRQTTRAHEGMYAIGVSNANPTFLRAALISPIFGTEVGAFNLTQTTSLTGKSAIVLAPEPGTMIALGLGAAALLRRRRQK